MEFIFFKQPRKHICQQKVIEIQIMKKMIYLFPRITSQMKYVYVLKGICLPSRQRQTNGRQARGSN